MTCPPFTAIAAAHATAFTTQVKINPPYLRHIIVSCCLQMSSQMCPWAKFPFRCSFRWWSLCGHYGPEGHIHVGPVWRERENVERWSGGATAMDVRVLKLRSLLKVSRKVHGDGGPTTPDEQVTHHALHLKVAEVYILKGGQCG